MPREFTLSVVSPDRSVVEEPVASVVLPGSEGYLGVQYGHIPLIAALRPGLLEYLDLQNQRHFVYLGGGFAEVREDRVTILADEADRARDIDLTRAEEALDRARRALRGEDSELDSEDAVIEVERALERFKAARIAANR